MPLLAIGPHKFEIEPLNYQRLEQEFEVKWPAISRFGARPGRQHTGFGEDPIRIEGVLYPQTFAGSHQALDALIETHKKARPQLMIGWAKEGGMAAEVFGMVVMLLITKRNSIPAPVTGEPRKIEFDIEVAPLGLDGKPIGLF